MNTNEVFRRLSDFRSNYVYKLCVSVEEGKRICPEEIEIMNASDPDEVEKWYAIQKVYALLDEAFSLVKYYESPVIGEGKLVKNPNGRYELAGLELTSGSLIELLEEEDETPRWVRTVIEHNGDDYYAVSVRGSLEGKLARYR